MNIIQKIQRRFTLKNKKVGIFYSIFLHKILLNHAREIHSGLYIHLINLYKIFISRSKTKVYKTKFNTLLFNKSLIIHALYFPYKNAIYHALLFPEKLH